MAIVLDFHRRCRFLCAASHCRLRVSSGTGSRPRSMPTKPRITAESYSSMARALGQTATPLR